MDRIDVGRPALIAGVLVLAACGGSESAPAPRAEPLIRDSAGVRTVVSYEARWAVGEGWRVSAEPVLRIGVVEGAEAYLFDRIAGMTRLSDGTLVVLDAGSTQLRYYSPAGEHVRSVGRRGQGPGEMRAPRWLERLPGDVVQVTHTDGRMRYGPDGTQVRDDRLTWDRIHEVGRRAAPDGAAGFLMESCAVDTPLFLGDGVLLCGSTYTDVRYLPDTPGLHRSVSLVAHADWAFETVDTIGIFHTGSLIRYRASGRLYSARISPPYGPRDHFRVHEIGADYILGLETDDLGVHYVAMYRLDRSGPSAASRSSHRSRCPSERGYPPPSRGNASTSRSNRSRRSPHARRASSRSISSSRKRR